MRKMGIKIILYVLALIFAGGFIACFFAPALKLSSTYGDKISTLSVFELVTYSLDARDENVANEKLEKANEERDIDTISKIYASRMILERGGKNDSSWPMFILSYFASMGTWGIAIILMLIGLILSIFNWWNRCNGAKIVQFIGLLFGVFGIVSVHFLTTALQAVINTNVVWGISHWSYIFLFFGFLSIVFLIIFGVLNNKNKVLKKTKKIDIDK